MSRTPNTPFIPPLPDGSPSEHPPVIPTSPPSWNPPMGGGYTPYPASPYSNLPPFIPQTSEIYTPGVVPGGLSPQQQQQPKVNSLGLSEDFTGYPQGSSFAPPLLSPNHPPPMSAFSQGSYGPPGPYPNSPYPFSAPAAYQGFNPPWASNTPSWTAQRLPPQGFSPAFSGYGPPPLAGPPPPMMPPPHMGGPPPHMNIQPPHMNIPPPQGMNGPPPNGQGHPGWPGVAAAYQQFFEPGPWGQPSHFGQPGHRVRPEPPPQIFDCMDPFTEGRSYGAVLDPFLVRAVKANVRLNPLITPLPEDGSDRVHLSWNMLFSTSTIQRSSDPSHISWSKGRDAPATFPRISSLRIVSDTIPWVLNVKAKDNGIGVTCGELIDSIGSQLCKFSTQRDYEILTPILQREVGYAYRRNRSREVGVPGGLLGQGMKRLDFLRQETMFAGIEVNERIVKRVCGEILPCVFVLKCSKSLPMTKQEVEDRQARLKSSSSPSSRPRSRATSATSANTRIMVHPPSTTGSDNEND